MVGRTTTTCLFLLLFVLMIANEALGAPKGKRGVTVKPKESSSLAELYQSSHAVIIGVNRYEKWPSLEYAVNDAKAMEEKLQALGFETTVLIDHHATRSNIVRILGDELPRKVEKNDRVVIFFAGHGQTEELADGSQMGYIVPVDADTRDLFSTAISMDQVRNFSKRLKAKHVLYLMDSCYSGLGLTRSGTIPPSERDYLRKITTRKAHQMLTAGGKGEQAKEEGAHGLFTKYILEALDGQADRDEKGYITFSDLAAYVKPKVSRETGNSQTPQYGNVSGEGEFVFVMDKSDRSDSKGVKTAEIALVRPPGTAEEKQGKDSPCARIMETADQYAGKAMWGNALIRYQKAEAMKCGAPELYGKLVDARDNITKRVRKTIAIFDFGSPSSNKDAGKIAAAKLIAYLKKNASADIRIMEREHLQATLREMQLGRTESVDLKSALNAGKRKAIDAFIMGDVLLYTAKTTDHPQYDQVKVLVSEENGKKNYQLITVKKGTAKITALIEIPVKIVDTLTGETVYSDTAAGKLIKEDKYSDGMPLANIPHDPLELPTEAEVLDELANIKISEIGRSVLLSFQSIEVEYYNQASHLLKKQNIDEAIERYMDAVYDEKIKGISTPISKKAVEMIGKLAKISFAP